MERLIDIFGKKNIRVEDNRYFKKRYFFMVIRFDRFIDNKWKREEWYQPNELPSYMAKLLKNNQDTKFRVQGTVYTKQELIDILEQIV